MEGVVLQPVALLPGMGEEEVREPPVLTRLEPIQVRAANVRQVKDMGRQDGRGRPAGAKPKAKGLIGKDVG